MTDDLSVRVSGGFGSDYPEMSPGLRARVAQADAQHDAESARAERKHRARWEAAHERAVDEATWRTARERGVPLAEARRSLGHTPREFVELASAMQDLEDAQRAARYRQQLRHAGIDPASGEPVDGSGPSERALVLAAEAAVRMAPAGEPFDPQATARGIRGKWLRRHYGRME